MAQQLSLIIDGTQVTVETGTTLLKAAEQAGIKIPTLCHREGLAHFTSCFLCLVEIEGRPNPAPACSTTALENMCVRTTTPAVKALRKLCLELLLSDHIGDCKAPCTLTCPSGCDIQQFLRDLAENRPDEAIRVIKDTLPIPGALGRICPRPCEAQCRRVTVEEPLAIGWLHRHAADLDANHAELYHPPAGAPTGKRVAIVGAGPAGLSAAYFLRRTGHEVVIFEAQAEPGGMLRYGIPAYRLPREELRREIDAILKMGAELRCEQSLGRDFTLPDLRRRFDAVFLATGAPLSSAMQIEGETLPGVMEGVAFLAGVSRGETIAVGRRVLVIGGGNTAIDALRTARRLGAADATLLYRRTRAEMPALPVEIEAAEAEGAKFHFLAAPVSIRRDEESLVMLCQQMELGPPGSDGRRKPVPVPGKTFEVRADSIITAIGQRIEAAMLLAEGVELDKWGSRPIISARTMETPIAGVFAGGDLVANEQNRIAVWAVGSGHTAAVSIDQYLRRQAVVGPEHEFTVSMGDDPEQVTPSRFAGIEQLERVTMPELEPRDRVESFREIELGLTAEMAEQEARRCLSCGCAVAESCSIRKFALEYGAQPARLAGACRDYTVDTSHPSIVFEPGKCINCGICVRLSTDEDNRGSFGFVDRGFDTRIKAYLDPEAPADARLKECADACPTGALVRRDQLGKHVCFAACKLGARLPILLFSAIFAALI